MVQMIFALRKGLPSEGQGDWVEDNLSLMGWWIL
jgi:hypothetical protein